MKKKRKNNKPKKIISYLLLSSLFISGFLLGTLYKSTTHTESNNTFTQSRLKGYEYINPLIDFESVESAKVGEIKKLEDELKKYIKEKTNGNTQNDVTHISIYYKDLNSGAWIGVNENTKFSPASLLKLPVMIAVYKLSESNPDLLSTEIKYTKENIGITQNIDPKEHLIEGETYTLDELVNRLIKYSDNDSIEDILKLLPYDDMIKIYSELGYANPYESDEPDMMTVKEYASFFRILYNASYLNKDMSEKALKLLASSEYDIGLAAGIPSDIKIADKFGERENLDITTFDKKQLHDCGIVYHPTKPYLICVMTKGATFNSLQSVLKDLSQMVYKKVDTE